MNGAFEDVVRNLLIGQKVWYRGYRQVHEREIKSFGEYDLSSRIKVACAYLTSGAVIYQGNIEKWFLTEEEAKDAPQV